MSKPCHYEVLGVSRDATEADVTKAYKQLAKRFHPDRHVSKSDEEQRENAERFKSVSDAHEVLSDPTKRRAYDIYGHNAPSASGADDAAAQAAFEQMFMGGAAATSKKPTGLRGGAMFVDAVRGHFFQRSSLDVEGLRREMTEGLGDASPVREDGDAYVAASVRLPSGAWEVRWVEADGDAATVTVTLEADVDADTDAETSSLKVNRTVALPADADVSALLDVAVDEGVVTVRVGKKTDDAIEPLAPAAVTPAAVSEASEGAEGTDAAETTPPSTPPAVLPPPRASKKAGRGRGGGSMRAGFLNGTARKPRRVSFGESAGAAAKAAAAVEAAPHVEQQHMKENAWENADENTWAKRSVAGLDEVGKVGGVWAVAE